MRRAVVLSACALVALGCGGPRVVPVTGVVTYKGEPLKSGSLVFAPEDSANARPANATIAEGGRFTPTTFKPGDGLMVGKFKVSVSSFVVDPVSTPPPELAKYKDGGLAIPRKYLDVGTSGLSVTVGPGDAGKEIKLELKD